MPTTLRVIAGRHKGRRLETPRWEGLRPTSDRLRETLFNVLTSRIRGAHLVDGFAGTGAVGIEAISRGAGRVTFVEADPRAVTLVASNLRACGIEGGYAIIRARFADAVPRIGEVQDGIVFLDPPYGADELSNALVEAGPLIGPGTLLVIEHAKRDPAPGRSSALIRTRVLLSGDSALAFYVRETSGVQHGRAEDTPRPR